MSGVFQQWMKDWDITHRPSSAYFPHSNSRAETAVKSSNPADTPPRWDKTGVVVEVRPHEQIVVKVDGSRKLTFRNRRFVRELDPRTSLENQPLKTNIDPIPVPVTMKKKKTRQTASAKAPIAWTPTPAPPITTPQSPSPKPVLSPPSSPMLTQPSH